MADQNPYAAPQTQDESRDTEDMKSSPLSINTRAVLIFALTGLALGWMFFFLWQFPWIVPADSNLAPGEEQIAKAGGILFVIAFISIWLPAGLACRGRWSLLATGLLLALTIYFGLALYPSAEVWLYPVRLAMHLLQCGILTCWAVNCFRQRLPSA